MSEMFYESSPETVEEKEQALFSAFDQVLGADDTTDEDKAELIGELYGLALEEGLGMEDIERIYEEARVKEQEIIIWEKLSESIQEQLTAQWR